MSSYGTTQMILIWWTVTTLISVAGMPLSFCIFRWFTTRGLVLSRIFSWLVWSYIAWILVSLGLLDYSAETLVISLIILVILSLIVLLFQGREFIRSLKQNYRFLVLCEGIFLVLFLLLCLFRAFNPDIAQQEKEADFCFLNGILRSTSFPPIDPWMSGETLNYFYFGFYCVANFIKLSGIPPPSAFNLAVAMILFYMTYFFQLILNL